MPCFPLSFWINLWHESPSPPSFTQFLVGTYGMWSWSVNNRFDFTLFSLSLLALNWLKIWLIVDHGHKPLGQKPHKLKSDLVSSVVYGRLRYVEMSLVCLLFLKGSVQDMKTVATISVGFCLSNPLFNFKRHCTIKFLEEGMSPPCF